MSVTRRGDKYMVRWREEGRQRARTFDRKAEATRFDRERRVEALRGPGRPRIGTPVNVRVDDDLLAWADEKARERGLTRAAFIRDALDYARAMEYPDAIEAEVEHCRLDVPPGWTPEVWDEVQRERGGQRWTAEQWEEARRRAER
jgi:hypothetical protein